MDSQRFDRITSSFAHTQSRRGTLRLFGLAAFGASGLSLLIAEPGDARRRKKKNKSGAGGGNQDGSGGGNQDGSGGGSQDGSRKQLKEICEPSVDKCASGLACGSPTTRHTCSSSVPDGDSHWCCVPPGGRCTECDCCGDYYCSYDDNNVPTCVPNPEG